MIAALALFLGIAPSARSQTPPLAEPMAEDYGVHVIPFYKINENWSAFLVIVDTSFQDLDAELINVNEDNPGKITTGTRIQLKFFNVQERRLQLPGAIVRLTKADAQYFALHDPTNANGQFGGLAQIVPEGVILLDGGLDGSPLSQLIDGPGLRGRRFLTYILLINGNDNSPNRIDSIPCQGPNGLLGARDSGGDGRWLRYDSYNTVAASCGDSGDFGTSLYFFTAVEDHDSTLTDDSDLANELRLYGFPHHRAWATDLHVDAWCDELYLGSRRRGLKCTQRLSLSEFNYTFLNVFPNAECAGKPGHIETFATLDGTDAAVRELDYSGFQEMRATLVRPVNLIGTGYMHHSENFDPGS
jgi:hypothetical protein